MELFTMIGVKLWSNFRDLFDGSNWMIFAIVFGAVLAAVLAAGTLFRPAGSVGKRMGGTGSRSEDGARKVSLRHREPDTRLAKVLKGLEEHAIATNEEERSSIRLRMIRAGFMSDTAVRVYYIVRVLLAVSLPVVFLLMAPTMVPDMPLKKVLAIAVGLCFAGLFLPHRWIQSKIDTRQKAITNGFPDALDMLVVCVEAGLGMDQAFVRVGEQIGKPHPVLASLLAIVALELRAGKGRPDALRNFAMRTGVQDVTTFVMLLIQSEELGADLSLTLKVQADEMRIKRMMRAEETAHKLPVKLTIPLVLCILPAMFAVVLGPAMVSLVVNVLPHLGK